MHGLPANVSGRQILVQEGYGMRRQPVNGNNPNEGDERDEGANKRIDSSRLAFIPQPSSPVIQTQTQVKLERYTRGGVICNLIK